MIHLGLILAFVAAYLLQLPFAIIILPSTVSVSLTA
jgi:hypothetical protein